MYDLIQAGANTFYIECPAKIGVWRTAPDQVWLIDSGNDKDAARRIDRILGEQGWTLAGVINTHSNADHIGGNAAIVRRTGCKVLSPPVEDAFTRHPHLEPSMLYGGFPSQGMRGKFLMAQPSPVDGLVPAALPPGLEAVPLPGHFLGMCGYRTADDVVFLADALFGEATVSRYHVFFVYDVAAYLETLDRIVQLSAALFVPSHAEATADVRPLAQLNRDKVHEVADLLCGLCQTPLGFDDLLAAVFAHYALKMDLGQHLLVGSTVRSYLSWLCDTGRLEHRIEDNRLLYAGTGA